MQKNEFYMEDSRRQWRVSTAQYANQIHMFPRISPRVVPLYLSRLLQETLIPFLVQSDGDSVFIQVCLASTKQKYYNRKIPANEYVERDVTGQREKMAKSNGRELVHNCVKATCCFFDFLPHCNSYYSNLLGRLSKETGLSTRSILAAQVEIK